MEKRGNLLNIQYLRRDQIWFTEKDKTDSSELYSLVEFRDEAANIVRNDRNIEKNYINGRYGAIPVMSWAYGTASKIKIEQLNVVYLKKTPNKYNL